MGCGISANNNHPEQVHPNLKHGRLDDSSKRAKGNPHKASDDARSENAASLKELLTPGYQNKQSRCDLDSVPASAKGSIQEFSFKGVGSMESSIDKDKDSVTQHTQKYEPNRLRRSATPSFKPSPFFLEKQNSERALLKLRKPVASEQASDSAQGSDPEKPKDSPVKREGARMSFQDFAVHEPQQSHMDKIRDQLLAQKLEQVDEVIESKHPESMKEETKSTDSPQNQKDKNNRNPSALAEIADQSKDETVSTIKRAENSSSNDIKPGEVSQSSNINLSNGEKKDEFKTMGSLDLQKKEIKPSNKGMSNSGAKMKRNLLDLVRNNDNQSPDEVHTPTKHQAPQAMVTESTSAQPQSIGEIPEKKKGKKNLLSLARDEDKQAQLEEAPSQINIIPDTTPSHNLLIPSFKTQLNNQLNLNFDFLHEGSPQNKHLDLDRTIYNVEDNISRMDIDKYSFYADIKDVEYDGSYTPNTPSKGNSSILPRQFSIKRQGTLEPGLLRSRSIGLDDVPENDEILENANVLPSETAIEKKEDSKPLYLQIEEAAERTHERALSLQPTPATSAFLTVNSPSSNLEAKRGFKRTKSTVIETTTLDKTRDDEGQKKINQYVLIKEIGRGGFGKVKLAINQKTSEHVAIKIANKNKLKKKLLNKGKSAFTQLQTEIAIMKKLDHRNIVRLFEVIDDLKTDKLYLVMEYIRKGSVLSKQFWKVEDEITGTKMNSESFRNRTLTEEKSWKYFRDLLRGMDYLHNKANVIHRDIKPENLLINNDDVLKISDFGISHIMNDKGDELNNNAGTKYFLAPETWIGGIFKGKPADIWAIGGTLFYFLYGKPPFNAKTAEDLKNKILNDDLVFPDDIEVSDQVKDLITKTLEKDPQKRITLDDIIVKPKRFVFQFQAHNWITKNGKEPLDLTSDDELFDVEEKDIAESLTKIEFRATVMLFAKFKKHLNNTRRNLERKHSLVVELSVLGKAEGSKN